MEKVDIMVYGRYILTLDHADRVIPRGAVAIRDGLIVDVGEENDMRSKYVADEVVERRHHIIIPGLIDCHTHTQQYLLRSAISDAMLQLPPVWTKVLVPFERIMGESLARLSTQASIVNMLKNGVTYFIEAGAPYAETLAEEVLRSGIRGVVTYATYDISEERVDEAQSVMRRVRELYRTYVGRGANLRVWMSIRQVMMVSEELMEEVIEFSREYGLGLTIHLGEYQGEVDYTLARYGMRPLEYMVRRGLKDIKPAVIAHGVFLSPKEVDILRTHGIGVCWCPTVDSWLMGPHWIGLTRVEDLKLGLGSDGGAWNRLDLLHEAKVAKALGKAVANAVTYFKAGLDSTTLLSMMTGSKGLMIGDRVGRVEKGFAADLTILDARTLKTLPLNNPVDAVVNYLEGDDVTDVMVGGKLVLEDGRVRAIDEEKILEELLNREEEVKEKLSELVRCLKI
ncbi:MAG: amidohydrolase family protein [Zestosphaera sp.]